MQVMNLLCCLTAVKLKIEMMLDELLMKNPIVFMLQEEARHISFSYGVVEFGEMPGDILYDDS